VFIANTSVTLFSVVLLLSATGSWGLPPDERWLKATEVLIDHGRELTVDELAAKKQEFVQLLTNNRLESEAARELLPTYYYKGSNLFERGNPAGSVPVYLVAGFCSKATPELFEFLGDLEDVLCRRAKADHETSVRQSSEVYSQALRVARESTFERGDLRTCLDVVRMGLSSPSAQDRCDSSLMLRKLMKATPGRGVGDLLSSEEVLSLLEDLEKRERYALSQTEPSVLRNSLLSSATLKRVENIRDFVNTGVWKKPRIHVEPIY